MHLESIIDQKQINTKSTLKREEIKNVRQKENQDLLQQQRHRLDDVEVEREDWLKRVEASRSATNDLHSVIEEEVKCRAQILELQKELSDAHIALQEERSQVLKISRDVDQVQLELSQDDRRLHELRSLVEPMEQDGAVQKNCRTGQVKRDHKMVKEQKVLKGSGGGPTALGQFTRHLGNIQEKPRSVIRTVQLPNEEATSLSQELEEVKRIATEEREMHALQVNALKEERRRVEEEFRAESVVAGQEMEGLCNKIRKAEDGVVQTTKEIISVGHEQRLKDRWMVENLEDAKNAVRTADKRVCMIQQQAITEAKSYSSEVEKKTDEIVAKLRAQTMAAQEQLKIVGEQHGGLQKIFREKINQLQDQIDRVAGNYKNLEIRKGLEGEGYRRDLQQLTKHAQHIEHTLKKSIDKSISHDKLHAEINKVSREVAEADKELKLQAKY